MGPNCWNRQPRAQPRRHRTDRITDAHIVRVHFIPRVRLSIVGTLNERIARSAYLTFHPILCPDLY